MNTEIIMNHNQDKQIHPPRICDSSSHKDKIMHKGKTSWNFFVKTTFFQRSVYIEQLFWILNDTRLQVILHLYITTELLADTSMSDFFKIINNTRKSCCARVAQPVHGGGGCRGGSRRGREGGWPCLRVREGRRKGTQSWLEGGRGTPVLARGGRGTPGLEYHPRGLKTENITSVVLRTRAVTSSNYICICIVCRVY